MPDSVRFRFTSEPLRRAVDLSVERRLKSFVIDEESEPVAMFSPTSREASHGGDWYGEHVGKWLVAASLAAGRTGDEDLDRSIGRVVEALAGWQEPDGYLGTYPSGSLARFTSEHVGGQRTWDLWVHAWLVLGLLATGRPDALQVAERIGSLVVRTVSEGRHLVHQGNHAGLSSLVMVEPLALLSQVTSDLRFATTAIEELRYADAQGLGLLSARPGCDVSKVGTGKVYQILWCLVGMLEAGKALDDDQALQAVVALYDDVRRHHLNPLGGPWGGVATHMEVFNPRGFFTPTGFVETCSSATWLDLSLRLHALTGDPSYADEAEKTLLNAVLGAQDADGEDWCYFTFANGRRNNTYHWACCKSSGALALERAARAAFDGSTVNLLQPFEAETPEGVRVQLVRQGDERFSLAADKPTTLHVRVPAWCEGGGRVVEAVLSPGEPFQFEARPKVAAQPYTHTVDHHGQEVVHEEYVCFSRGPFVLAAGPDGDIPTAPTVRLPRLFPLNCLHESGDDVELRPPGGKPVTLSPYYRAGGAHHGAWRNTWLPVAWQ
ncbi:MAG: glycoside hydrolase family 127 protein [Fimbriimonadaceae bacterium]|nr:glycoside hydrolase family 127 protein [Fimbriimonadaceae bacterium]